MLKGIQKSWKLAKVSKVTYSKSLKVDFGWLSSSQEVAFFTFKYPPLIDQNGDCISHYILLIADPTNSINYQCGSGKNESINDSKIKTGKGDKGKGQGKGKSGKKERGRVYHIDSRGLHYARRMHPAWSRCQEVLEGIFQGCKWVNLVREDLQAKRSDDHFCQTWSLLIGILFMQQQQQLQREQVLRGNNGSNNERKATIDNAIPAAPTIPWLHFRRDGFSHILWFLRQILLVEEIADSIYYEIYRSTHSCDGSRRYDRYFSTLEMLVTGSRDEYYPHGLTYNQTGYTFIEEFIHCLDSEILENILS